MRITSLKQQVKNPERVSVFVDSKYSFSLSLSELTKEGLKNNQEIDQPRLRKLKKISADGKLKAKALAWLLSRPHSTRELRNYLIRKKAGEDFTEGLIKEFTRKNYLSDEDYAEWVIELRQRSGKSNRALKRELFSKGVKSEIVEAAMLKTTDEEQRLKMIIDKKSKLSRYKDNKLKLTQYLTSQGFDYELVKKTLSDYSRQ